MHCILCNGENLRIYFRQEALETHFLTEQILISLAR